MDGSSVSGGSGFVAANMILELKKRLGPETPLLGKADLLVGTSAGSFNALFLAMHDDPDAALDGLIPFWQEITDAYGAGEAAHSPCRFIRFVTGQAALLGTRKLREVLIKHLGATTTLADLKQKVAINSFQLDSSKLGFRTWKPKIFHNQGGPEDPDLKELVVDVAMRSSSPPILAPIYQGTSQPGSGYVDGGIFANNPALIGLSQSLRRFRPNTEASEKLDDILMLSVGNAVTPAFVEPKIVNGVADWGYAPWLLNMRDPMLLVFMNLEANVMAVEHQALSLLGDQYCRLNPVLPAPLDVRTGKDIEPALQIVMAQKSTQDQLALAAKWVEAEGWNPKPSGQKGGDGPGKQSKK